MPFLSTFYWCLKVPYEIAHGLQIESYNSKSVFYCLTSKTECFEVALQCLQTNWFLLLVILMKDFLFIMTNGIFSAFLICISVEDLLILELQTLSFILWFSGFQYKEASHLLPLVSVQYWDRNTFPFSLPVRTNKNVHEDILSTIHLPKELQLLLENLDYKPKPSCHLLVQSH